MRNEIVAFIGLAITMLILMGGCAARPTICFPVTHHDFPGKLLIACVDAKEFPAIYRAVPHHQPPKFE